MSKQPPSQYPHGPPPQPSNTGYSSDTTVIQDVPEPKAFNEFPSKHHLGMLAHNFPYPLSMNILVDKDTLVWRPFFFDSWRSLRSRSLDLALLVMPLLADLADGVTPVGGPSTDGVPAGGLPAAEVLRLAAFLLVRGLPDAEVLRLAAFLLVVFQLQRCFGWWRFCWWSSGCGSCSAGGVPAGGPPAAEVLRLAAFLLLVSVLLVVLLLLTVPLLRIPPLVAPPLALLDPAQCWPSRHAPMYWLSSKLCCPAPITTANCMG